MTEPPCDTVLAGFNADGEISDVCFRDDLNDMGEGHRWYVTGDNEPYTFEEILKDAADGELTLVELVRREVPNAGT